MKLLEKDMEDLIIENPQKYLNEPHLKLVSRQYSIGNYRFDLLFEDRHQGKLIVEIQRGTLDRNHTYKILDYFDEYKKRNPHKFIDLMIVANKIIRERRDRLKSYGITFFEIPESIFLDDPNWLNKKHNNRKPDTPKKNIISTGVVKTVNNIPLLKGKKFWSNGEPRGAVKEFFVQLVSAGCYTVEETQKAMRERYPEIKEGTVVGYPHHGTNINGDEKDKRRLPYKAVIGSDGIIRFDKKYPAGSW